MFVFLSCAGRFLFLCLSRRALFLFFYYPPYNCYTPYALITPLISHPLNFLHPLHLPYILISLPVPDIPIQYSLPLLYPLRPSSLFPVSCAFSLVICLGIRLFPLRLRPLYMSAYFSFFYLPFYSPFVLFPSFCLLVPFPLIYSFSSPTYPLQRANAPTFRSPRTPTVQGCFHGAYDATLRSRVARSTCCRLSASKSVLWCVWLLWLGVGDVGGGIEARLSSSAVVSLFLVRTVRVSTYPSFAFLSHLRPPLHGRAHSRSFSTRPFSAAGVLSWAHGAAAGA